jgi:hypothetical protein
MDGTILGCSFWLMPPTENVPDTVPFLQWNQGKLVNVIARSLTGGSCRLRYGAVTRDLSLAKGQSAQWDGVK